MKTHKTEHFVIKRYADGKIHVNRKSDGYGLGVLDAALAGELADGLLAILTAEERQARIPEYLRPKEQITCPHCNGTGLEPNVTFNGKPPECFTCHGKGTIDKPKPPTPEELDQWEEKLKRDIPTWRPKGVTKF